jgi:hypothetical protein
MSPIAHLVSLITFVFPANSEFPVPCDRFVMDDLENIYFVCDDHIEKYNLEGKLLFRSSDLGYGDIYSADASNSLKPFVYYRDQNVIVTFDNTLSSQGNAIDLKTQDFGQVELVGASRDNCFWLWNTSGQELIRVTQDMRVINTSPNIGSITGLSITPVQIIETLDAVFLCDPDLGLLEFDIFGTFRRRHPIAFVGEVGVRNNMIFYQSEKGNVLHLVHLNIDLRDEIILKESTESKVEWRNGRFFYISGKKLHVQTP